MAALNENCVFNFSLHCLELVRF